MLTGDVVEDADWTGWGWKPGIEEVWLLERGLRRVVEEMGTGREGDEKGERGIVDGDFTKDVADVDRREIVKVGCVKRESDVGSGGAKRGGDEGREGWRMEEEGFGRGGLYGMRGRNGNILDGDEGKGCRKGKDAFGKGERLEIGRGEMV